MYLPKPPSNIEKAIPNCQSCTWYKDKLCTMTRSYYYSNESRLKLYCRERFKKNDMIEYLESKPW